MDDYTALVSGLTGLSPAQIGSYLLALVSVSTVAGLVAPWLQSRLPEWQDKAAGTASEHDDRIVRVLAVVLQASLIVVSLTAWVVPRFAVGMREARDEKLLEDRR